MGQHSLCITCSIWARRLDHYYNIQIDTHIGSIKLKAQVLRHTIFLRCMIFEILQVPKSTERANSGHVLQGDLANQDNICKQHERNTNDVLVCELQQLKETIRKQEEYMRKQEEMVSRSL